MFDNFHGNPLLSQNSQIYQNLLNNSQINPETQSNFCLKSLSSKRNHCPETCQKFKSYQGFSYNFELSNKISNS